MAKLGRNDPCWCGSRQKYKRCHLEADRTQGRLGSGLSLRERNIILLAEISDIFRLRERGSWEEIKKDISAEEVKKLYITMAALWPPDTKIYDLLPAPENKLRALYLGEIEPQHLIRNISRFSLYSDEILVVSPFHNPWLMSSEFNPIEHPGIWKEDTLKLVYFATAVAPWVLSGLLTMVPSPGDFDPQLRQRTMDLAAERLKDSDFMTPEAIEEVESFARDTFRRSMGSVAPDVLAKDLREKHPHLNDEEVAELVAEIHKQNREDPLYLNQKLDQDGQVTVKRTGANLEMALAIAELTGAFPYTSMPFRWKELMATTELPDTARMWTPLTRAFQQLSFEFLDRVDPKFASGIRQDGRLEPFRAYLRGVWREASSGSQLTTEDTVLGFTDQLKGEYLKAQAEWAEIRRSLLEWGGTAVGGAIVAGGLSLEIPALGFGITAVTQLVNARAKRRQFRQRVPMSLLVDLSRRAN
jgi:hypothetical protein